ncbi:MAG: globin [Planctomycetota bacterium]
MSEDGVGRLYERVGEEGFARLCAAFYRRVPGDDILGPMYRESVGDDLAEAERRLRLFLIQRCGGPAMYAAERGHPRLRMRHMPFRIDQRAADRWLRLMSESMAEAGLDAESCAALEPFFVHVADFMRNVEA